MKTIRFTKRELIIIKDALKKEIAVGESNDEWNTDLQGDNFIITLRQINDKIGFLSQEDWKSVFPKMIIK